MVPILEIFDSSTHESRRVGIARFTLRKGRVSTTFSYDNAWLAAAESDNSAYALDPALPLVPGILYSKNIPRVFSDSAPDRWGRLLIARQQYTLDKEQGITLHQLDDVDFLIGVHDVAREGSLRFCEPNGAFLATSSTIPPLIELPRLLHAANEVASHQAGKETIKELLDAGSGSLGGARPKASVCDGDKLLLAKFSHPHDDWSVMAWEKTMLDLAMNLGLEAPPAKLISFGDESVLTLERFDRKNSLRDGLRIPYMSAMTLLQSSDGDQRDYAELAEGFLTLTNNPTQQLRTLFTRIAFSLAVGNTDDHLRNWGFLRTQGTWHLSPVFDVNPNPYSNVERATTIAGHSKENEAMGLKDLAVFCNVSEQESITIVKSVLNATRKWELAARKNGIGERELALFRPLFEQKQHELRVTFGLQNARAVKLYQWNLQYSVTCIVSMIKTHD